MYACVLSRLVVSDSLRSHELWPARLLCPWGFSRQEYWSGLPCPPPGDLSNPGIKPRSPALQKDSLPSEAPGNPTNTGASSISHLQGNFLTQLSKTKKKVVYIILWLVLFHSGFLAIYVNYIMFSNIWEETGKIYAKLLTLFITLVRG